MSAKEISRFEDMYTTALMPVQTPLLIGKSETEAVAIYHLDRTRAKAIKSVQVDKDTVVWSDKESDIYLIRGKYKISKSGELKFRFVKKKALNSKK